jgi:hypothetical protein
LNPPAVEKSAGADEEGIGPLSHKRCKCGIDLAAVGSVEDLDLQPEGTSSRFDLFLRAPLWALAHAAVAAALPPTRH